MAFRDNTENKRRFNRLRSYLGDNFGNRLLKEILSELEKEDDISIQTYDSLKATKENNQLVAGKKYLMTDFQTIHIIPNTVDENTVQDSDTFYARGASQAGASSLTTANLTLAIKNIGEPLGFGFSLGNIDVSAGNNYGKAEIIAGIKANFLDLFHPEGNADLEMFVSVDASDNLNATLKTSTDFDLDLREYIEVSGSGFTLQWGTFETVEAWQPEIEPLILTAISSSEFDAEVKSPLYPQDSIWYDIDNTRWGAYESPNSKGYITRRKDNINNIDICCDWRNVRLRSWKATNPENGGIHENYIWDTSVTIGTTFTSDLARISLVATDSNDYVDTKIIATEDSVKNLVIKEAIWWGLTSGVIPDIVFTRGITECHIVAAGSSRIHKQVKHLFAREINYTIFAKAEGYTTELDADMIHIEENAANLRWVYWELRCGFDLAVGSLTFVTVYVDSSHVIAQDLSAAGLEIRGALSNINNGVFVLHTDEPSRRCAFYAENIVNFGIKGKLGSVSDTIGSYAILKNIISNFAASSTWYNTVVLVDVGNTVVPQYDGGNYSNFQISKAAAATVTKVNKGSEPVCGVYNLTGSGTVTIGVIDTYAPTYYNRVPLKLVPEAGLIIQITNNDVNNGILTNNLTYEANGTNGEFILLRWEFGRYVVISGRTTP